MKRDVNTLSLLNEISELVYVSDIETYELLFVNQTGCQTLHLESYEHKKCYEVLHLMPSRRLRPGCIFRR